MVKFSIVMPTYRRPHTLPRAVESVLAQTYPHWQLILVNNDAGPLGALPGDPRIRAVQHAEVTSAAHARNMGLGYVTGDLVSFFDDDDTMEPTYLERFADTFRANPDAGAVRCGMVLPGGRTIHGPYATPCVVLRREFATPTWGTERGHDQRYYRRIIWGNGWTTENGGLVEIGDALVNVHSDPTGGLREGSL